MATYWNPWHQRGANQYGPRCYETSVEPVIYRGHRIYNRIAFDVVRGNMCIGQYAGLNGAKRFIDMLMDGRDEVAAFNRQRVSEYR